MSDQSGLVAMPNTYNLDEVREAFTEGLGKCRLKTIVRYTTGPQTLTGNADEIWGDTTSGSFTVNLPAAPLDGDHYEFAQIGSANTLTIGRNGKTINGAAADMTISAQWAGLTLTWSATANTWWSR